MSDNEIGMTKEFDLGDSILNVKIAPAGLHLVLRQRTTQFVKDQLPQQGTMYVAELLVWAPSTFNECSRLVSHWLSFWGLELDINEFLESLEQKSASAAQEANTLAN